MSNFILHKNTSSTKSKFEFLLNVQSELLNDLKSRLVIPVIISTSIKSSIKTLNPEIEIEGKKYFVLTQQMAAVPVDILGNEIINTKINRVDILSAIDFLITGF